MMMPVTVFLSCTGAATVYPTTGTYIVLDYLKTGPVTVASVATTSGQASQTYTIEWTLDSPSSLSAWFSSGSSNNSSNSLYSFAFPIRALRTTLQTGTSNTLITTTVVQSAV